MIYNNREELVTNYRVSWKIDLDGEQLYKAPLGSYSCRDAGAGVVFNPVSRMMNDMLDRVRDDVSANSRLLRPFGAGRFRSALATEWYRANRERFVFTCEMHTADEDRKMPLVQANNDRLIDRLRRKWPTLTWEPTVYNDGFAGGQAYGAIVTGDYAILQAFYWFIVLQRATHADRAFCATREGMQWKDVNKLIERQCVRGGALHYDWPYARAWENLRYGTVSDYITAWNFRYGPIAIEQNPGTFTSVAELTGEYRAQIDELLPMMVPDRRRAIND